MADLPETRSKKKPMQSSKAEKGMTVQLLMKNTPMYVRMRSLEDIVVKRMATKWTKGGMRAVQATAVNMSVLAPTPHTVTVIGLDEKSSVVTKVRKSQVPRLWSQRRVQVDCDCEFFTYYCEYALWFNGAAKIRRCNGEPAVVKNPSNVPLVCKHIYAVLKLIKEHSL